ncbi:MAG: L-alanine exporter AlaE [Parvibaculaceae bacterium]
MRKLIADTVAMQVFSFTMCLIVEVLVSGMTLMASLQARATAIPVNLVTARPYGAYRDWLMRKTGAAEGGMLARTLADTLAFLSFQMPLYVLVLLSAGATLRQIVTSCAGATVVMLVSGRPYGLFLDLCRYLMGVRAG